MQQILTHSEISGLIPCSDEFIMLDRVMIESDTKISGLKAVSLGEWYFMGHFPGHPIFPGVLQVEAFSQLAEILAWKKLDPSRTRDVYVKTLERVKFRRPNNPGDRMFFTVEIVSEDADGIKFSCSAKNAGGPTAQAVLTLSVRDRAVPSMPSEFNQYDKLDSCAMDVNKIASLIPHRYPFLLVDYLTVMEKTHVIGVKNACSNERSFRRYADGYRVMSGSVHPEIIAQAGCINVLNREENHGKIAYFMGIDKAEYLKPVLPGDQLVCDITMPEIKSKFGKAEAAMTVNGEVVTNTTFMYALIDA